MESGPIHCINEICIDLRCYRRSGGRWSWKAWRSWRRTVSSFWQSPGWKGTYYSSSDFLSGGVFPAIITSLAFPDRRVLRVDLNPRVTAKQSQYKFAELREMNSVPFPDFMTKARRLLMLSAVFFAFLTGAIVALQDVVWS